VSISEYKIIVQPPNEKYKAIRYGLEKNGKIVIPPYQNLKSIASYVKARSG